MPHDDAVTDACKFDPDRWYFGSREPDAARLEMAQAGVENIQYADELTSRVLQGDLTLQPLCGQVIRLCFAQHKLKPVHWR